MQTAQSGTSLQHLISNAHALKGHTLDLAEDVWAVGQNISNRTQCLSHWVQLEIFCPAATDLQPEPMYVLSEHCDLDREEQARVRVRVEWRSTQSVSSDGGVQLLCKRAELRT
jgi:hypothetical protein